MPTNNDKTKSYAWTFGSRVCVIGLTALFGILSARLLGPTDKGTYTVAALMPAALSTFAMLAGPQIVVADFSNGVRGRRLKTLLSWSLSVALAGGIISTALQLASSSHLALTTLAASGLALLAPALVIPEYLAAGLQADSKFGQLSLLRIVQVTVPGLPMLLGVAVAGLLGAVIGFGIGTLLVGIAAYVLWHKRYVPSLLIGDAKVPWKFAITTNLTLVLLFLSYRVDVLILEAVAPSESVGIYTASVALAELVLVVSMSAAVVRAPVYARRKLQPLTRDTWLVFALSVLAAIALAALAPFLVPLLFGEEYVQSIQVCWALLPGICFLAAYRYISNAEIVRGHKYGLLTSCLISIGTDVVLILLLAPTMGAAGAALAASGSYASGLSYLVVHRLIRPRPRFLDGNFATRREALARRGTGLGTP